MPQQNVLIPPGSPPQAMAERTDLFAAFDAWNRMAAANNLPLCRLMNSQRRARLKARITEAGIGGVLAAIEAIPASSFLLGDNDRGWRADFDFLVQERSFARIIEGAYAGKRQTKQDGARRRATDYARGVFGGDEQ